MGRKRRRINQGIPKGVYRKRENWIYREYLGREDGRTKYGPDIYLCAQDAPMSELFATYERAIGEDRGNVTWLLKQYHKSPQFKKLMPRTQADYASYKRLLTGYTMQNGRPFGEAPLDKIRRTTIRGYLDRYKGGKHPIAANRHIQYLKAAWSWAEQRFDTVPENPCKGVRLNEQTPRDRYVTDKELETTKACASARSYIPIMMELAYLCRLRSNEIRAILKEHIEDQGLRIYRGKGSRGEITAWTPRLRAAVNAALAWNKDAPTPIKGAYLIHDKNGLPIGKNAYDSAWRRVIDGAKAKGIEPFTFHDLKAKGYTDQIKKDAGHRSDKMDRVYDRKGRLVQPADGERLE